MVFPEYPRQEDMNSVESITRYIDTMPDINAIIGGGKPLLYFCLDYAPPRVVKYIFDHGAVLTPNEQTKERRFSLFSLFDGGRRYATLLHRIRDPTLMNYVLTREDVTGDLRSIRDDVYRQTPVDHLIETIFNYVVNSSIEGAAMSTLVLLNSGCPITEENFIAFLSNRHDQDTSTIKMLEAWATRQIGKARDTRTAGILMPTNERLRAKVEQRMSLPLSISNYIFGFNTMPHTQVNQTRLQSALIIKRCLDDLKSGAYPIQPYRDYDGEIVETLPAQEYDLFPGYSHVPTSPSPRFEADGGTRRRKHKKRTRKRGNSKS